MGCETMYESRPYIEHNVLLGSTLAECYYRENSDKLDERTLQPISQSPSPASVTPRSSSWADPAEGPPVCRDANTVARHRIAHLCAPRSSCSAWGWKGRE